MGLTIGVDIGGTKVLGGVVDSAGDVLAQTRRDTPAQDPGETADRIIDVIKELAASHPVDAVGIGAAGWIDATRSIVQFAPNLAWRNEPLRDKIVAAVGLPCVVENDGNVAAWAEFRFGAAHDADDSMVLFTVGTGIGGGIVIGGNLIRGAHGIAGELGHALMVPNGHPCGCGRHGCLEQYASGRALVRFARADARERPEAAEQLLNLVGGEVDKIDGPAITQAARAGDPVAIAAFEQVGRWLGVAFADIVQVLDSQVIVVGGGVIDAGDLLMKPARASYEEQLAQRGRLPVAEVRPALMGNLAGVVGAADLARV
ncbi:ROK family glucokinase [Dactylosporangium fulvum]|uniref:Glucokinase n=1 Tax=Dactylosporangium fulvum TaxID=53359 RepID=A0ABY5VWC6_9ACTN|nr:ROK family glucokinase [Dactylosporangium fulvum]UWP81136.1 ROK family glucokinase [Dactylosporangium fulvum]